MLHAAALAVVSALCALAFSAAWRALALRWNWLDRPNARSLHTRPVPRGGGVAIVAAAALSLGLLSRSQLGSASVVVAGFFLTAAVGLWDDRFGLPPLVRLGFQAGAAAAVVAVCGGLDRLPLPAPLDLRLGWLGSVMAFVWIVAVVNFYNFLDGLDGLAATQAIVTGAALALCTWDGLAADVGAALAGACAGFLVFNWSPARLFM